MKKTIAILLLITYISSFTHLEELVKFNAFIEHYKEHKKEQQNTTIFSFIYIHYLNGSQKDADYEKDNKLPYKIINSHHHFIVQDLPKSPFNNEFPPLKSFEYQEKNFYYTENFSHNYTTNITHPPEII